MPGAGTEINVTVGFGDLRMMDVSYACHMCVLLHVYMIRIYNMYNEI